MKKISFLFLFLILPIIVLAKENAPDPFYLSSPQLDYTKVEKEEAKPVDPRTLKEKLREKFHLKPSSKVYIHNIDRSNQPITIDDYYKLAVEKKRKDFVIPEPVFTPEAGYVFGTPNFRVVSYNMPPGQKNIDLTTLLTRRVATSAGILSPDKTKMVYTKSYFYPRTIQTASMAYNVPVDSTLDAYNILYKTNVMQADQKPIVRVGIDELQKYQYKTLFPIDWSKDSTKIALKEKVGSNIDETWQTNVIIYDYDTKRWKRLTAIREAIIYWWRQNKQIELKDYMWDIFPIGWDKNEPDRLIVYAYAFTKDNPFFLGTWSIDYNEAKSKLISIDSTSVEIDLNGFGFKEIKLEN